MNEQRCGNCVYFIEVIGEQARLYGRGTACNDMRKIVFNKDKQPKNFPLFVDKDDSCMLYDAGIKE